MPQPTKGPRFGGSASHQKALLANLATSLFEHGRITTTEAKARRLRPVAERLITKAKRGDLHNRRIVMRTIRDKSVAHVLLTEIGPRYANRPGGYTRITKLGPRKGDNAPMAVIELVEALTVAQTAVGEAEGATKRAAKRPAPAPAPAAPAAPAEPDVVQTAGADPVDETDVTEADVPAEGETSDQVEGASETSQAEGDDDETAEASEDKS